MNIKYLQLSLLSLTLLSCGANRTTSSLSTDSVDESSATAIDEAADALSDGGSASASKAITFEKSCDDTATGTATVTVTTTGSGELSIDLGSGITRDITTEFSGTETRLWTPDTGEITCGGTGANEYAIIPWASDGGVTGYTLEISGTRTRNTTIEGTRLNGDTFSRSRSAEITSSRTITFGDHTVVSETATIQRTVVIDTTKVITSVLPDGTSETSTNTIKTKADAPLDVTVVRSAAAVSSRTINSGTLEITRGTTVIEVSFEDWVYSNSSDNSCVPVSGTISGSIFENGATTATSTFTGTAGDSTTIEVTYGDGTTGSLEIDSNCDLKNL